MVELNKILFGLIDPKYYYLILPASLLIIGFMIKQRAKNDIYVGRLTMFSNSMALLGFYSIVPNIPLWMVWIVNISVILGLIGIISYSKINQSISSLGGGYYKLTKYFDSITVGLLIIIYYLFPNFFV